MKKLIFWLLIYLVLGAVIPFLKQKDIGDPSPSGNGPKAFLGVSPHCDRARLLTGGDQALEERLRLISNAQRAITLSTYDFASDESGKKIISALMAAAERGVRVRLIVDGFCADTKMKRNRYFAALAGRENVDILVYNPIDLLRPWRMMGRMHDKYFIADDSLAIVGGRNISDAFLSDSRGPKADRDLLVYCPDPCPESFISQLKAYSSSVFSSPYARPFRPSLKAAARAERAAAELADISLPSFESGGYMGRTYETDSIALISNPIDIYSKEPTLFRALLMMMDRAKRVRIHTPYVIFNSKMYRAFAHLCGKSDVSVMLNSAESGVNIFASGDYYYNKDKIASTGADIMEYSQSPYHGKSITFDDDICAIGSFNFDIRSTYINTEIMAVVKSRELSRALSEDMERYEASAVGVGENTSPPSLAKRLAFWTIHRLRLLRSLL